MPCLILEVCRPCCLLARLAPLALAILASVAPQGARSAVIVTDEACWDAHNYENQNQQQQCSMLETNLLQTAVEFRVTGAAPIFTQSQSLIQESALPKEFFNSSVVGNVLARRIHLKFAMDEYRKRHPILQRILAFDDAWRPSRLFKVKFFFFEDAIFVIVTLLFLRMHYVLINKVPPEREFNAGKVLGFWIMVAVAFTLGVFAFGGPGAALDWASGYMLEFVCSLENIFAYLAIFRSFQTPRKMVTKVLGITVFLQVIFQLFMYEDLARWLRSQALLPFLLGTWLCILGLMALEQDHSQEEAHDEPTQQDETAIHQMWVVSFFHTCLGKRLQMKYKGTNLFWWDADSGFQVTLLGPVTLAVVATAFFLEVDVTLTKIENTKSLFLAFTSSAIAAFAVPVLYYVAQDMFGRYELLHYGICFVLIFFGCSLIFEEVVYISAPVQTTILVMILLLCVLLSETKTTKEEGSDCDSNTQKSSEEDWSLAIEFIDVFGLRTWLSSGADEAEEKLR